MPNARASSIMIVSERQVAAALPDYELGAQLGAGGSGLVLAARHRELDCQVAIKIVPASPGGISGVAAEARLLARLDHPHIVRVYDYIQTSRLRLVVMEFLGGGTLADHQDGMAPEGACAVGLAVAAALSYTHARGVLHRDIKPDNILFDTASLPKVADFGIAKIVEGSAATASQVIGTPAYMAPEQILGGRLGPATDLYALGVVLYKLLTGAPPFDPDLPLAALLQRLDAIPAPPAGVPPPVAAVVLRALAKDPGARHRTAHAFALDLAAAATHAYGPGWVARPGLLLHLADDVRAAADPGTSHWPALHTLLPSAGTGSLGVPSPKCVGAPGSAAARSPQRPDGEDASGDGGEAPQDSKLRAPDGPAGTPYTGSRAGATGMSVRRDAATRPDTPRRSGLLFGGIAVAAAALLAAILVMILGVGDGSPGVAGDDAFALPEAAVPLSSNIMVYASQRNDRYSLFTSRIDEGGVLSDERQITNDDVDTLLPVIVPGRKTVIYHRKGVPPTLHAVAADGSGTPVQLFTSGPAANLSIADDARPSISPDGRFLVVRSTTDATGASNPGLYVVSMEGSSVRRLDAAPQATDPAWAPSGEVIAYWSNNTSGDGGFLVVIPAAPGGKPLKITPQDGSVLDADPAWSPNSAKIVFRRIDRRENPANEQWDLFIINPDGTGERRLTELGTAQDPAFSPRQPGDSSQLLFTALRPDGDRELYLMLNLSDPANIQQLTNRGGNDTHPQWGNG